MYTIRAATEDDWDEILRVACEAAPWAADGNAGWLAARRSFRASGRRHRHEVAVDRHGRIIACGAVEEDEPGGRWRLFLVMRSDRLTGGVGEDMLARLIAALRDFGATAVWMREQAQDRALIAFAREHRFAETRRFTHDAAELVVMERSLAEGHG